VFFRKQICKSDYDEQLSACQGQLLHAIIIIIIIIIIIKSQIQKEAEKILKYKDLTIEIQRMRNVKSRVIPVIIAASGTISKSFRKYVSTIPGKP
jgi:uncharacterized membrane protein